VGIYLVHPDHKLVELEEHGYVTEDALQAFLARYPNLMAGDQVDPESPRRWLFVRREAAVPSTEGGAGRWALDHLLLDQDAIPTLVEVKRASDSRIRREVVGQLLDYAANAVVYWPGDSIRAQFEGRCLADGQEPNEVLSEFLLDGPEPDVFWKQVSDNLRAGKIRMVFLADSIPTELQRIVEFLNEQMSPAQVMALEVRQYVGEGLTALVPKVVGQTASSRQRKGAPTQAAKRQWDEKSFFEELEIRRGTAESEVARAILRWARASELRIWWGKGSKDGSFFPMVGAAPNTRWTISVWTYGRLEVQFSMLANSTQLGNPFAERAKREELLTQLNAISGVELPPDAIDRRPSIPLANFVDTAARDQFLAVLDWLVSELRSHP
jgi:hypothetical protein